MKQEFIGKLEKEFLELITARENRNRRKGKEAVREKEKALRSRLFPLTDAMFALSAI